MKNKVLYLGLEWNRIFNACTPNTSNWEVHYNKAALEVCKTGKNKWECVVDNRSLDYYTESRAYKTRNEAMFGCMVIVLFMNKKTISEIAEELSTNNDVVEDHLRRWV